MISWVRVFPRDATSQFVTQTVEDVTQAAAPIYTQYDACDADDADFGSHSSSDLDYEDDEDPELRL